MSLIFGIVHHKTNNVVEYLTQIENAILPTQFNKKDVWVDQNVGLGNILRINTPESLFENLPFTWGEKVITSTSRLDNREELMQLLNIPTEIRQEIPDSILFLKAFEKWGEECVHHIDGDWAFAIWDKVKKQLFIARDHFGNTGLYFHQSNNCFVFSSNLKGILVLKEIPIKVNELSLAGILINRNPDNGETAYENIYELQRGHCMTLKDGKISKKRFWFPEKINEIIYKTKKEYLEHFINIYQNSVNSRLRNSGKIGTTLSGGLDSGSVSVLAAKELAKKQIRLQAYTAVPSHNVTNFVKANRFGDETSLAQSTANFSGNIDLMLIKGEYISILEGIKRHIEIHSTPPITASNSFWIHELLETAQKDGIKTLFTGQAGNSTISWKGLNRNQNSDQHFASNTELIKNIIKSLMPASLISWAQNKKNNPEISSYSAINPLMIQNLNLQEYLNEENNYRSTFKTAIEQRFYMMNPKRSSIGSYWQTNGYHYGINIVDPTRDKKLTEFCLAIPDHFYTENNENRHIIRESMIGLLPEEVRLNKKIGLQSADSQFLIQNEYYEIINIISTFENSELISSFLNLQKMKKIAQKNYEKPDHKFKMECDNILMKGIGIGLFLQQFN